jgi:beta-xylosidase
MKHKVIAIFIAVTSLTASAASAQSSKGFKNGKLVGNVISRPSQMNFMGYRMTREWFAPAISYNNGIHYA